MPNTTADDAPGSDNEVQVVLSTKMIETVRAPLKPVYVRFAVPLDWFTPAVCAPDAPPPPRPLKLSATVKALKTVSTPIAFKTLKTRS